MPLDPEYMTPDELKQLQTQAMLPEKAIRATLSFIQVCQGLRCYMYACVCVFCRELFAPLFLLA